MDEYFKKLDKVPLFPSSKFKNDEEKEHYETQLMFAFRKYQAAQYHFKNVLKFLKEDDVFKVSGTVELTANNYVYELSAFLEAIKSAIDFLATVTSSHFKGMSFDKISSLIKFVKKRRINPIFNQIAVHFNWLSYIREYRHHLVHRLLMNISKEYMTLKIGDSLKTFSRPIIVPEESPKYFPDTRRSRFHNIGSSDKFGSIEIRAQFENESVTTHVEYLAMEGYIPIDEFMENQLNKFGLFFKDMIDILTTLDFKQF